MSATSNRDNLPRLRVLTTEELDTLRLKLWKQFGETLCNIESEHSPDDLLQKIVAELVGGMQTCPGKKTDPPTCLSALVKNRIDALAKKRAKTRSHSQQRQRISEQFKSIDALPIEKIREELRTFDTEIEEFHAKIAKLLDMPKLLSKRLKQLMIDILWIPEGAGQPQSASGIFKQEHSFSTDEGNIKMLCLWEEQHDNEPTCLWLSWEVHLSTEKELWLLFLDPETQGIRYEVNLGTDLTGETTFTKDELGFDPIYEKWAVSIMLQEAES